MADNLKKNFLTVMAGELSESCFEKTSNDETFIDDLGINQKCGFTTSSTNTFKILNPAKKDLYLLSVDGCWFDSSDKSRCDGIVFDDKELCFFELKLNSTSTKNKRRKENFKKAISQLETTINYTKKSFLDKKVMIKHKMEAFICMRMNSYPSNKAYLTNKRVEFLIKNKLPLFHENKKTFYK